MYNVLYIYVLKIHSFWKKRARERRRDLKKIDRIKDSTTRTRLLICILRRYSNHEMMCVDTIKCS
jgi:hypothetical protein